MTEGQCCGVDSRILFECHGCRLGSVGFAGGGSDRDVDNLAAVKFVRIGTVLAEKKRIAYQKLKKSWTSLSEVDEAMPETWTVAWSDIMMELYLFSGVVDKKELARLSIRMSDDKTGTESRPRGIYPTGDAGRHIL